MSFLTASSYGAYWLSRSVIAAIRAVQDFTSRHRSVEMNESTRRLVYLHASSHMQSRTDSTKDHILSTGRGLVAQRGFAGMGLNELLKNAAVPKGSFYHYFSSKEDFGSQLLEQYLTQYLFRLDEILSVDGPDARARLMHYCSLWISTQTSGDACAQCLIVKIGAEISDVSDEMRSILERGTRQIGARLSQAIIDGQADLSISQSVQPDLLGPALYEMWLGASLMAKLSRTRDPFLNAMETTELLLPPPSQNSKENS